MVTATRNCRPYTLRGSNSFQTETEARKEEARIKKQKKRKYIEWLLDGNWQTRPGNFSYRYVSPHTEILTLLCWYVKAQTSKKYSSSFKFLDFI